ncbi:MAG: hypothetical protein U0231_03555 [Nitrospiraceae bacterium]
MKEVGARLVEQAAQGKLVKAGYVVEEVVRLGSLRMRSSKLPTRRRST